MLLLLMGLTLLARSPGLAAEKPGQPSRPAHEKPNVLLVITDDQGYGDLGIHGNQQLRTPNLDRFAGQSVRFERFYVHPFCSPTRAAMLTGRYPLRTGVWGVTADREMMRAEEVTLAETLREAGYRTGCFGKWHNGMQFPHTARGQGFEEFFGFVGGHWNRYFDATLEHNGRQVQTQGYIADVLTDAAIDFLRRHKDEPFFCYVPYNTPHSPDQVSDSYFERYKSMGLDDHTAAAYGMCENIDDNFGRLVSTLDELGLSTNTIVLFLTDNGPNGLRYNAGMRGAKGSVHEGGCRVPLFVRWPGRMAPRQVDTLAAHIDLYPTLLDLCGVARPGHSIDGVSLRPLLEGSDSAWPQRTIFTQHGSSGWDKRFPAAVRTDRYRAVRERAGWELYDMERDPGQKHDIAGEHPAQVQRLAAEYERWYEQVSAGGWQRPLIPVGHREQEPVEMFATQARFDPPIHYFASRAGFANDWLTGWTDPAAKIQFDMEVVRPGRYAVILRYTATQRPNAPKIRVRAGSSTLEIVVPPTGTREIPLPNRNPADTLYHERTWSMLEVGEVGLDRGSQTLTLEAVAPADGPLLDLKSVVLRRQP